MKKILVITRAENGWIVNLFQSETLYVYHTIDEIQKALPELLKEPVQGQDTVKGFSPP